MKILCLNNNDVAKELFEWIQNQGHDVTIISKQLNAEWCRENDFDLTVSYTYRYIIPKEILDMLGNNVVNLHISYLPWNRGADPNLWSILEGTPRGVTLHYITPGLDKGDIIAQRLVADNPEQSSLSDTYNNLDKAAKELFKEAFAYYEYWNDMRKKAVGEGTYHSLADAISIRDKIDTWDISVEDLRRICSDENNR